MFMYNKQNITCPLVDMIFIFTCSTRSTSHSFAALTLEISSEHSKIKFLSMRTHVISSLYVTITLEEIVIVMIIFQIVPEKHLRRRIYEYSFSKSFPISASIFYQMILIKQECNPTGMNSREICKDTKVFFLYFSLKSVYKVKKSNSSPVEREET